MIRHGENHPRAKLTAADVIEIRKRAGGWQNLAKHYGVNKTTIKAIQQGRTWKHVA